MRITTTVTQAQVMVITGAKAETIMRLRAGTIRQIGVGPLGSGKVTFQNGVFRWTRNPETVHASLRSIDIATR